MNDLQFACLVDDAELIEVVKDLADDLPHLRTIVVVGNASAKPHESWNAVRWPDWNGEPD